MTSDIDETAEAFRLTNLIRYCRTSIRHARPDEDTGAMERELAQFQAELDELTAPAAHAA